MVRQIQRYYCYNTKEERKKMNAYVSRSLFLVVRKKEVTQTQELNKPVIYCLVNSRTLLSTHEFSMIACYILSSIMMRMMPVLLITIFYIPKELHGAWHSRCSINMYIMMKLRHNYFLGMFTSLSRLFVPKDNVYIPRIPKSIWHMLNFCPINEHMDLITILYIYSDPTDYQKYLSS